MDRNRKCHLTKLYAELCRALSDWLFLMLSAFVFLFYFICVCLYVFFFLIEWPFYGELSIFGRWLQRIPDPTLLHSSSWLVIYSAWHSIYRKSISIYGRQLFLVSSIIRIEHWCGCNQPTTHSFANLFSITCRLYWWQLIFIVAQLFWPSNKYVLLNPTKEKNWPQNRKKSKTNKTVEYKYQLPNSIEIE